MPDLKGSAAAAIASVLDTTRFLVSNGGADGIATGDQLRSYIGKTVRNQSTAAQAVGASATAYLAGSDIVLPASKMKIGTRFYWQVHLAKTNAGTVATNFHVRVGTLGTVADAARLTFTTGAGTAAADEGILEVWAQVNGPLSAAGILQGSARFTHNLASTGWLTVPANAMANTSAGFDVTAAGLIVGLSIATGASYSVTVRQVQADAYNL